VFVELGPKHARYNFGSRSSLENSEKRRMRYYLREPRMAAMFFQECHAGSYFRARPVSNQSTDFANSELIANNTAAPGSFSPRSRADK
jgi:hypothetical protein